MKKIASILLTAAISASIIPTFAAETETSGFTDIAGTEYYAKSATALHALNILSGYEDGSFGAGKNITRAEMATIICTMLNKPADTSDSGSVFDDVPNWHWANGFIKAAGAADIITGDGDGKFRPDDSVKYEEVVKMIVCAAGLGSNITFNENDWSAPYISIADEKGITENSEQTKGSLSTRGDVAVMVFNGIEKIIAVPTVSVKAGAYSSSQRVALTTPINGVKIYYTTDGTNPTTLSKEYTSEILIDKNTILKAAAIKTGVINSGIMKADYLINSSYGGLGNINSGGSGSSGSGGGGGGGNTTVSKYSLSFAKAVNGTINDSVSGKYEKKEKINISATPDTGYVFAEWQSGSGSFDDAKSAQTTFTMPAKNVILTAVFELAPNNPLINPDSEKNGDIDRQQWLGLMFDAMGITSDETGSSGYSDITADNPYLPEINTALAKNIILPNDDGKFYPDSAATTAFAAATALRALGYETESLAELLEIAEKEDIIGSASIDDNLTEAQAQTLLDKLILLTRKDIVKTFDFSLLNSGDSNLADENNPCISFYDSQDNSKSEKYLLAQDFKLLVNDTEVSVTQENIEKYLLDTNNEITVVDVYDEVLKTDGLYDKVCVSYYAAASIFTLTTARKIIFDRAYNCGRASNIILPDKNVDILLNNKKIKFTDLQRGDVISIAFNVNTTLDASDFYKIYVSRNTVKGVFESDDDINKTVKIDGTDYEFTANYEEIYPEFIQGKSYLLFLDTFGRIFDYEIIEPPETFAILDDYSKSESDGSCTVTIFTADGKTETLPVDTSSEDYYTDIADTIHAIIYEYDSENKNPIQNRVITYEIADGKIVNIKKAEANRFSENIPYNAASISLGAIKMGKYTQVIDALNYSENILTVTDISAFIDNEIYTGYSYGRPNADRRYYFVLITAGSPLTEAENDAESEEKIGIIENYWYTDGDYDYANAQICTVNNEVISIPAVAKSLELDYSAISEKIYNNNQKTDIQNRVITYKTSLSTGRITSLKFAAPEKSAKNQPYNFSSDTLGKIKFGADTVIFDAVAYIEDINHPYYKLELANISDFTEGGEYSAYAFGKTNSAGEYPLVIVTAASISLTNKDIGANIGIIEDYIKNETGGGYTAQIYTDRGTLISAAADESSLSISNDDIINRVYDGEFKTDIQNRVIKYTVSESTGELTSFGFLEAGASASDEWFDTSTKSLGNIKMDDNTRVIDAIDYCELAEPTYKDLSISSMASFSKNLKYTAFAFGENTVRKFPFVIVTCGSYYDADTNFAVVSGLPDPDEMTPDSDDVYIIDILYDGETTDLVITPDTEIIYKDILNAEDIEKGDVIIFRKDYKGNAKTINIILKASDIGLDISYKQVSDNSFENKIIPVVPTRGFNWTNKWNPTEDASINPAFKVTQLLYGPVIERDSNYFYLGSVGTVQDRTIYNYYNQPFVYTGKYTDIDATGEGGCADIFIDESTNVYVFDYFKETESEPLFLGNLSYLPYNYILSDNVLCNNGTFIAWDGFEGVTADRLRDCTNFVLVKAVDYCATDMFVILSK